MSELPLYLAEVGDGDKRRENRSSFQALSGRLEFTVRRHQFNNDSPCTWPKWGMATNDETPAGGNSCENRSTWFEALGQLGQEKPASG